MFLTVIIACEKAVGPTLEVVFLSELFQVLRLLIPVLKNPFRICFDIQLDLHEPAGGCQPNAGLIPGLLVCACECVCVQTPAS